jgi:hypothetical protein
MEQRTFERHAKDLHVVVWKNENDDSIESEIPPLDCNHHADQGMLVYFSHDAACQAAAHQDDMYENEGCYASYVTLTQYLDWLAKQPC